jgi:hypothetical protein
MYSFLCIKSTRKCHYKLYHLKCVMAGAYGIYYTEIFGTHFYRILSYLNFDGDRFVVAWVLYESLYKREQNRYLSSRCANAQQIKHFVVFRTEIFVK